MKHGVYFFFPWALFISDFCSLLFIWQATLNQFSRFYLVSEFRKKNHTISNFERSISKTPKALLPSTLSFFFLIISAGQCCWYLEIYITSKSLNWLQTHLSCTLDLVKQYFDWSVIILRRLKLLLVYRGNISAFYFRSKLKIEATVIYVFLEERQFLYPNSHSSFLEQWGLKWIIISFHLSFNKKLRRRNLTWTY